MSTDPHVYRAGDAPTPFTADEIREGCPAGRVLRLRVGKPTGEPIIRVVCFVEVDQDMAIQIAYSHELDGTEHDEPTRSTHTWAEFQSHASFPLEKTSIDEETRESGLGRLDCLRYTVVEGIVVDIYWFATALPGMPIRVETYDDGNLVHTMEMIENTMPSG